MARDTFVWWYHWTRTGRVIADHIEVLVVESFRDGPGWTTLLVLSTSHFIPLFSLLCSSQSFPLCPMSIIGHWRNILPLKICMHGFCSFNIILRMPSMWKVSLCILSDCIVCQKFIMSLVGKIICQLICAIFLSSSHYFLFPPCRCTPSAPFMMPCLLHIPRCLGLCLSLVFAISPKSMQHWVDKILLPKIKKLHDQIWEGWWGDIKTDRWTYRQILAAS